MIKILISGIAGRMGQELLKEIEKDKEFIVCAGFDKVSSNNEIPIYNDIESIKEQPDVIIDFSNPKATLDVLEYAKQKLMI